MACQLGYLYNRDAVLECLKRLLVDEIPMPPLAAHITTLKDLTTLKLAPVESAGNGKGDVVDGSEFLLMRTGARFACPLTGAGVWRDVLRGTCAAATRASPPLPC